MWGAPIQNDGVIGCVNGLIDRQAFSLAIVNAGLPVWRVKYIPKRERELKIP